MRKVIAIAICILAIILGAVVIYVLYNYPLMNFQSPPTKTLGWTDKYISFNYNRTFHFDLMNANYSRIFAIDNFLMFGSNESVAREEAQAFFNQVLDVNNWSTYKTEVIPDFQILTITIRSEPPIQCLLYLNGNLDTTIEGQAVRQTVATPSNFIHTIELGNLSSNPTNITLTITGSETLHATIWINP